MSFLDYLAAWRGFNRHLICGARFRPKVFSFSVIIVSRLPSRGRSTVRVAA
jgi:hypothetical protein